MGKNCSPDPPHKSCTQSHVPAAAGPPACSAAAPPCPPEAADAPDPTPSPSRSLDARPASAYSSRENRNSRPHRPETRPSPHSHNPPTTPAEPPPLPSSAAILHSRPQKEPLRSPSDDAVARSTRARPDTRNCHTHLPSTGSRYAEAARSASRDTSLPTQSSAQPHCSPPQTHLQAP